MIGKTIRIGLYLAVFSFVLISCIHYAQPERWVWKTSKCLFAVDEDGGVLWKTPIESRAGGSIGPDTAILGFRNAIRWYDCSDGSLIRELKFDKEIHGSQWLGELIKVHLAADSFYTLVDGRTGKILGTEPYERPEMSKRFSEDPAKSLVDSLMRSSGKGQLEDLDILLMPTVKLIFAFDEDANLVWKVALPENWKESGDFPRPYYGKEHTVGVTCKKDILGLDLLTGKILYKKILPASIDYSTFSGNGIIFLKLKDGHWYQFTPKDGEVVLIK